MSFCLLHISDIHFGDESTSGWVSRNKITEIIKEANLEANCIVISGDLFNRGSLHKDRVSDYKEFLEQLPGHSHIIVVPGNHDLNRLAQRSEDESYNIITTRQSVVLDLGEEVKTPEGEFSLTANEKTILYKDAFHAFQRFSQKMGFQSFCQPNAPCDAENYEVQVVDLPFDDTQRHQVRFVLLNTALIAGQSIRGRKYHSRQRGLKESYRQAQLENESVKAAEIALKIARLQQRYEDDGELIIDEEMEDGSGRLALSKDGNRRLANLRSDGAVLTIFVGHHGFQFLSRETQEALKEAMKGCKSSIYLCGHAHQAHFSRFPIRQSTFPKDIEQVQAGVMFKEETGFAQYGFSYASFSLEGEQLIGEVSSYFITKSASEELRWIKDRVIEYSLHAPVRDPKKEDCENTYETSQIENIKNDTTLECNNSRRGPAATASIRLSARLSNDSPDS